METRHRRQSYGHERTTRLTVPGQLLRRSPRHDSASSNKNAAPPFHQRNSLLVAIQESSGKSNMVKKLSLMSESSAEDDADESGSQMNYPPSQKSRSQEFKTSVFEKFANVIENRRNLFRGFIGLLIFLLFAMFAFYLIPLLSPLFEGLRNNFLKLEDFLQPVSQQSDFPIKTPSQRFDQVEDDGIKEIAKKLLSDKRFHDMIRSFSPEITTKDELRMKELISKLEAEVDSRGEAIRKDFRSAFEELEQKFQHVKSDVEAFQKENQEKADALQQGILLAQDVPHSDQYPEFEKKLNYLKSHFDVLAEKVEEITLTIKNCQKNEPEIEEVVQTLIKQHYQRPNLDLENWAEEHIPGIKNELKAEIVPVLHQSVKDQIQKATSEIRSRMDKVVTAEQPLSTDEIVKMVQEALTTYDADKTGLFDFALESAGGSIESTRCTEDYDVTSPTLSVFGITLPSMWKSRTSPRAILEPGTSPGNCWAFKGSSGAVVIRLSSSIHIGAVTMEHTAVSNAPDGNITSAPKDFQVFGLNHANDNYPVLLGNFTYKHPGLPVQTFYLTGKPEKPYQVVELQINSNHGNPAYTCLYRFRVHGSLETAPSFKSS